MMSIVGILNRLENNIYIDHIWSMQILHKFYKCKRLYSRIFRSPKTDLLWLPPLTVFIYKFEKKKSFPKWKLKLQL